jgi:hypothetical protein
MTDQGIQSINQYNFIFSVYTFYPLFSLISSNP